MFAAAVKISLNKFPIFHFSHFWQCHLEAKNGHNLRTKGDTTKNLRFDLVYGFEEGRVQVSTGAFWDLFQILF